MPSATSEIVIDRAREEVFAFLADPENDPQWRSGVLDLKRVTGSGIGARYTQGVKGPGGRRIPADIEITELTPGEAIAFHTLTGPVRPRGRYRLAAVDGGTRVRFELEADLKGLKRLIAPMVQKTMNNEVRQLDSLKRVIEER
ncbi:MAG: SRPBCC family protein [Solirubrobacterales bacterium]|nr:SRPBCC family protein [Solirubrobacterales bacterium]MBV9810930.1 SRPBCC family protein [Solirubrobacterales bacterium]